MALVQETTSAEDTKKPKSDHEGVQDSERKPKKSKLPAPRSFTLIPDDFYPYVAALSPQDWGHVALYVYRLANPRIIRDPSNVDCIDREPPSIPFTEQYLKDTQGSGKFEVKLNDTDARQTVCRMLTDINDPDYPPKFDIRELDVGFKGNRLIVEKLKREGKLSQDGDVIVKQNESGDAGMAQALKDIAIEAMRGRKEQPGMENQAFSKMMEMMASASKQSIEIALGQVKKDDPASFIALLSTAKELFTPAKVEAAPVVNPLDILVKAKELFAAPAKPAEDPMMKLLMDQLSQSQKDASAERQRNHELQLKMLESKAEAADPMEMVEKVLNIQEKLGGGGEPRNWKEKLVDQGFAALPDILTAVKGYSQRAQQQPIQRPVQQAQQQPQPAQAVQTQPTPPAQPQGETVPQTPADTDIAFLLPILESQGRRFVTAFKNDPLSGGEVARSVSLYADTATYERIARMGRMKILATIDLLPEMKADLLKVGTQQMLDEFIDDFVAGPEDPDEDDGDDNNDDDGDNGEQEPGFADPANPEERQPPRTGKLGPVPTRPKNKKKVPA